MDLLGHPEYIQPLREEIQQVIAEDGYQQDETGKNYLSKTSLNKLKKLDSFIKESQRLSPLNFGKATQLHTPILIPVTYLYHCRWFREKSSERLHILQRPEASCRNVSRVPTMGCLVSFHIAPIPDDDDLHSHSQSETTQTFSPSYNSETKNAPPAEFDGFRFSRLREIPGREMKHQAATTGPDAFNFGHGPHSCPGRFFAVYMIKCILVELLMGYDMQLKSTGTGPLRPANIVKQTLVMPDSRVDVEIKRRVQV